MAQKARVKPDIDHVPGPVFSNVLLVDDRNYVTPDDVKAVAPNAVGQQLVLAGDSRRGYEQVHSGAGAAVVRDVLSGLAVPLIG